MPKNLMVFIVVCIAAITVNWVLYQEPHLMRSKTIPSDTDMTDFDGKTLALKDIAFENDMVIHFWATWCPPCIAELPSLLTRAAQEESIPFVIISVDADLQKAVAFVKTHADILHDKSNIHMIHDANASITQDIFDINTFPETIILNHDFSVRKHIRGTTNWETLSLEQ